MVKKIPRFVLVLLMVLTCLAGLTGCASKGSGIDAQTVQRLASFTYPESALHGKDFDILVIREGETLKVINQGPDSIRSMQLWLNQQYVKEIDMLPVGESNWALLSFINSFEESYPIGGFLAPDKSRPLLIAELYDPETGNIHRLVVQPEKPVTLPI